MSKENDEYDDEIVEQGDEFYSDDSEQEPEEGDSVDLIQEDDDSEPEPEPPKPTSSRPVLNLKPAPAKRNYFAKVEKSEIKMFSSGCAVLDCVLGGGFPLGRMSNIVGDKSSGKTLLAIEACSQFLRRFPDGDIKYFETESAFDVLYAEALGMPVESIDFIDCEADNTVEFLFNSLTTVCEKSKVPTLYIVDSMDALSDRAEQGRKIDEGTYAMGKQKKLSEMFRRLIKKVEASSVHLMIVSQVRERIGQGVGEKYTRAGGKGLDFYASQILWLAEIGKLKKTIKGVERVIGIKVKAKCKKNKVGLPFRECEYPVYFGYGIDDIEAGLKFLETVKELGSVLVQLGLPDAEKMTPASSKKIKAMMSSPAELKKLRTIVSESVVKEWESVEEGFLPKTTKY